MLQIDIVPFASDALEDAMRLAQVKALNSFSFSDCLTYLNYAWRDIYDRMAMIDDGYYGINMKLTSRMTRLPAFVKNTMLVYAAQSPVGYNRYVYRRADNMETNDRGTYIMSGNELWCPDAERITVWLYFVPECKQLFFTHHNRDPKIYADGHDTVMQDTYGLFRLEGEYTQDEDSIPVSLKFDRALLNLEEYLLDGESLDDETPTEEELYERALASHKEQLSKIARWYMVHRGTGERDDITDRLLPRLPGDGENDGEWVLTYVSCDYPYIFMSYEHSITGEHVSGFFDRELGWNEYNPFAFTGRNSNVEYMDCHWNDKTGLGVVIKDYNDAERIKELGWTPDTPLRYPRPEMYRLLVARLADKFSAMNESSVMAVQKELTEAKYAFEAFFEKDKAAWKRIHNVNPPSRADWL